MDYLLLLIPIGIIIVFIWSVIGLRKQSENDWAILHDLEQRASNVKTKEEIEELHDELVEKGNKIFNKYVNARLATVEGYLRGLYQQFKN